MHAPRPEGTVHCPSSARPHATTVPPERIASEWYQPAEIRSHDPSDGGTLAWPSLLEPHAHTVPSDPSAIVWYQPAATRLAAPTDAGTEHCPEPFHPQHATTPSLLRATECRLPSATDRTLVSRPSMLLNPVAPQAMAPDGCAASAHAADDPHARTSEHDARKARTRAFPSHDGIADCRTVARIRCPSRQMRIIAQGA